jgi:hypothetical protein
MSGFRFSNNNHYSIVPTFHLSLRTMLNVLRRHHAFDHSAIRIPQFANYTLNLATAFWATA